MLRIALRPTAGGLFWLASICALLATAINYGNNLVFALAFLLLATWLQAAWECRHNLSQLSSHIAPPQPAFAGETLTVELGLSERAGRPRRQLALAWEKRTGAKVGLDGTATASLSVAGPAGQRGRRTLAGLHLVSAYPLGLWRARCPLPAQTALIYPAPAGGRPLPDAAPNPAHRQQAADDFQDVRAYAPGDAPRRINWRVFGRREELVVNRYDGGQGGHALWLDIAQCDGDLETRLAQLARWVLDAEQQGREYGLRLGTDSLPPGRGKSQRDSCMRCLALHAPAGGEA